MKQQIALALRVLVLYPLGPVAALLPFVAYDSAAATLTVDLDTMSLILAGMIWSAVSGSTFIWSRLLKGRGWIT